ncbi:MAG TPA: hypothetical protein VIQ99_06485, partial [Gammaproteobacteria bacterium]
MTVVSASTIPNHLDFLVMQPDQEHAIVRDLVSAVFAFNAYSEGEPLQISFPMYTDEKVSARGVLGPCVRVTGPSEKLYVLTLRYEVSAHLRAGRAMTLVRDKPVVEAGRNERFTLLSSASKTPTKSIEIARARPLVLSGHSRVIETAGSLGIAIRDEAAFVERGETKVATEGEVDLLGFSDRKTVPVLKWASQVAPRFE